MGNDVFGKEFYDKMKKYIEQKGIKCESTTVFAEAKNARSATFTLTPHETSFTIKSRF